MFGFSSFSETPFSALPTAGDVWNEIRNNTDQWIDVVDYDSTWQSASSNSNSWVEV